MASKKRVEGHVGEGGGRLKASAYPDAASRGAPLVARAIEACRERGLFSAGGERLRPEPMASEAIAALRLPGDRPLSPGIATWLAFDVGRFGWSKGFPNKRIADLVPDECREDLAVPKWLNGTCLPLFTSLEYDAFLYIGEPDDLGEYPVLSIAQEDDDLVLFLRTPSFDVYMAESFGLLDFGESPPRCRGWSAAAKDAAKKNLHGKLSRSLLRADRWNANE